jgi:hypothetical protein
MCSHRTLLLKDGLIFFLSFLSYRLLRSLVKTELSKFGVLQKLFQYTN